MESVLPPVQNAFVLGVLLLSEAVSKNLLSPSCDTVLSSNTECDQLRMSGLGINHNGSIMKDTAHKRIRATLARYLARAAGFVSFDVCVSHMRAIAILTV